MLLALEVPAPGVEAAAALPHVSRGHAWGPLSTHLSQASLLQDLRGQPTTSPLVSVLSRLPEQSQGCASPTVGTE